MLVSEACRVRTGQEGEKGSGEVCLVPLMVRIKSLPAILLICVTVFDETLTVL